MATTNPPGWFRQPITRRLPILIYFLFSAGSLYADSIKFHNDTHTTVEVWAATTSLIESSCWTNSKYDVEPGAVVDLAIPKGCFADQYTIGIEYDGPNYNCPTFNPNPYGGTPTGNDGDGGGGGKGGDGGDGGAGEPVSPDEPIIPPEPIPPVALLSSDYGPGITILCNYATDLLSTYGGGSVYAETTSRETQYFDAPATWDDGQVNVICTMSNNGVDPFLSCKY